MAAVVLLILGMFFLWLLFSIVQFAAVLTLISISVALMIAAAGYGFSFLALYFILGAANTGWAIFGAMFIGTLIVSKVMSKAKAVLDKGKGNRYAS